MKHYILILLILVGIFSLWMVSCADGKMTLSTGIRYDMFTDDRTPEMLGYEVTFPLGVAYRGRQLALALDAAFSSANVYPGDGSNSEITSLTDTHLSASYGLPNLPVGVIFGIDLNLPTGKGRLSAHERVAEVGENHNLFEVDDFGEGFNFDLSLGLAETFGPLSLGLNGQYRYKGAYDPTRDIPNDKLDPGDEVVVIGMGKWKASARVNVDASVAYSHFAADQINGQKMFQEGDKFVFGGNLHVTYSIPRPLRITLGLQQRLQASNKEPEPKQLQTEPENSNGNEFFSLLEATYEYSPRFAIRVLGDVRYYGASDRQDAVKGVPYKGRRIRYAFGPGFFYSLNARLALNGLAKYFFLNQKKDILLNQDTTFRGVNLAVGVTYMF
jgi:hypothetical protein